MKTFDEFLNGKGITKEAFEKKQASDMAGLYNDYNAEIREAIKTSIDAKASKEDVEKLKGVLIEAQAEQLKSLNEAMKANGETVAELGIKIKKLISKEGDATTVKSLRDALEEKAEDFKKLASGESKEWIRIKAASDMAISTNISGGNVPVEQRIAGFNLLPQRKVRFLDLLTPAKANSNLISWVYQTNEDGAAGGTLEGAVKNQIDFDLVVGSQAVVKRTAYIKATDEMLMDIDQMQSTIQNHLLVKLLLDVENTAFSGNGTAPSMNGVKTVATAFSAGVFATTVDNANEADVITVAMNQIMIANQPSPNAVLMHPSDVTKLKLYKVSTTDKRYVDRLTLIAGELTIDGVPIIPTTLVTAGEYLVGYFSYAKLFSKEGVSIEVGLDGNDFTKNFKTIRAEFRGAVVVENNFRTAFVKGVFATDKAALETP